MWLQGITDFILKRRIPAILIALICGFVPLLGTLGLLILGLVTLRKGPFEGGLVLAAVLVPYYFILAGIFQDQAMPLNMLVLMMSSTVLIWLLALLLRACGHWNAVLQGAIVFGLITMVVAHVSYPDLRAWWSTQMTTYLNTPEVAARLTEQGVSAAARVQIVTAASKYMTGLAEIIVLCNALLQLLLARWWQALIFNPGGLRKELHQIRLSHFAMAAFGLCFLAAWKQNPIAVDMMPALFIIFAMAGLSVVHIVAKQTKLGWPVLLIFYGLLIWQIQITVIFLAVLACFDTGFDMRKRLIKNARS